MIVYFDVYSSLVKSYEFSSGNYGSNNVEKTRIDVISGAVDDIIFLMERLFYNETVEAAKENLKKRNGVMAPGRISWYNGGNP